SPHRYASGSLHRRASEKPAPTSSKPAPTCVRKFAPTSVRAPAPTCVRKFASQIQSASVAGKRGEQKKRPLKTVERVLSKAGLGPRVEARRWVHAGRVKVNGTVTRNPDQWIDMERDRVRFDDKPLVARDRLYVLLYKPTGYLTTYKDPEGRPTVYDLVA